MQHESTGRPASALRPRHQRDDRRTRFRGRADSQLPVVERADANADAHVHAGTAGAGQKVGQTNQIRLTAGAEHARGGGWGESQWLTLRTCKHAYARAARLRRANANEVSQRAPRKYLP